ncbi:MAG: peptidylprolyl isomerase [Deinococcus sp.]|uniref:peptidylprolyl isomerase n=1 Tax=Deinococcus sp. TaxID=47478 RepID=UPI0026DAD322|nr:peptidylprolyl isomerase [Deinococcus sp.]MDO4246630.1 peptidylprolyl isomerase [Deinococcus sp.]
MKKFTLMSLLGLGLVACAPATQQVVLTPTPPLKGPGIVTQYEQQTTASTTTTPAVTTEQTTTTVTETAATPAPVTQTTAATQTPAAPAPTTTPEPAPVTQTTTAAQTQTPAPVTTPAPTEAQATTATVTQTPAAPAPTTQATASDWTVLAPLSAERKVNFARAEQVIDPAKSYRAVLKTSKGDIVVNLDAGAAPLAVNNFVFLALNRFYDGTRFHRVIDGFMAQAGDPQSAELSLRDVWGTGGPGYQFANEKSSLTFDKAGVLAMANAGPDTNGSQFFITFAPTPFLNGGYTIFGQVAEGQDVADKLTRTMTGNNTPIPGAEAEVINTVEIQVK